MQRMILFDSEWWVGVDWFILLQSWDILGISLLWKSSLLRGCRPPDFWPSAGGASPTKFGNRAQWGWEKFANASVTQLGSIKQWHVHACTVEVLSKGILGYLWHKAKKPWALKLRERSAKVKFSWIVPEIQSSRKSEKGWNSVLSTSHKCSTTLVFTQVSYSFVQRKPPQNWTWTKWKSLIFGQVYCGESGHFCSPSKWEATLTDRTS
jgi:hypothetical protein